MTAPLLSTIVGDLMLEANPAFVDGVDFDVSALAGIACSGFAVGRESTVRQAIDTLRTVFFFDVVEEDGKLKAVLRGGAPTLDIDLDDLAAVDAGTTAAAPYFIEGRVQDLDLPRRITLTHQSAALDYQPDSQGESRINGAMFSGQPASLDLPILMTEDEAKAAVARMLYESWLQRSSFQFALPPRYMALGAGQVVRIPVGTTLRPLRITQIDLGAQGMLQVTATAADEVIYGAVGSGAVPGFTDQVASDVEATTLLLIDGPLLRDGDDSFGFYAAAHGDSDAWRGATIFRSTGGDYDPLDTVAAPATAGASSTTLADAKNTVFDRSNTVTVVLDYGELASVTELEVLNGKNYAMLGDELIAFATATLTSPGTYLLSTLLRGVQGTDWASGTHTSSDRFVLVNSATLRSIARPLAELNASRDYKGVSFGLALADAAPQSFTAAGVRLKPLAPVHIAATRDGGNNATITWTPRARKSVELIDGNDTPIDEPVEAYSIDILSGVTVVRTLTAATPTVAYSAANATTDGLPPAGPVSIKVYQLSNRVGRGYPGSASV